MKTTSLPKMLLFTTGLPGAGKTTFALKLAQTTNTKHISVDKIAFDLFTIPSFKSDAERELVYREADYKVEEYFWDDYPVIYDGNVNNIIWRKHMAGLADKHGVRCVSIYIKTPVETSRQRALTPRQGEITQMIRSLAEKQFNERLEEFIEPDHKNDLIQISGTDKFEKQFREVQEYLTRVKV